MTDPTRIIAVVSFRHSGSTLLGSVLGASRSATFVGETDRILHRRDTGPPRCRCNAEIADCDRWSIDADEVGRWPPRRPRDRRWLGVRRHIRRVLRGRDDEALVQRDLWTAAAAARRTTLVDSSKDLRLLRRQLADHRWCVDVVHLVRAPGPTVASCLRRGARRDLDGAGEARRTVTGLAELSRWTTLNLLARPMLGRRAASMQRVRFEDLGEDPAGVVTSLAESLGIEPPDFDGRCVTTEAPHMIRANRSVGGGPVELRAASRSVDGLPPVVAALCRLVERSTRSLTSRREVPGNHSRRPVAPLRDEGARVGSHT